MNAVVFKDETPFLELTAEEFVFPVLTPDEQFTVLFHMKRYRSADVKKFYSELVYPKRERVGNALVFKAADHEAAKKFVDAHFLRMGGVKTEEGQEATIEQQREWLDEHPDFKLAVFRQGYDNIMQAPSMNGNGHHAEKPQGLVLFKAEDHKVPSRWKLWSTEKDEAENVIVTHHLARLTQQDRHQYNTAIQLHDNQRRQEQYVEANWDVIELVYDRRAKRLDGALLDGEPCNEANKDKWIPLVPFTMKVFVLGQILAENEIKNA